MKVLITGGFGYLGGRVAQFLASNDSYKIYLGSRSRKKSATWLPHANVVQTAWKSHAELVENCSGSDAVIHFAGMNAEDCLASPVDALEFNGLATARLIDAATQAGVKRFIYLSTGHVYGSPLSGIITEETCPMSLHPYASSHRAGEDVVRESFSRGDIEGIVIRLSNSFGAPAHKDVNCWMLLVNDLCRQAIEMRRMQLHSSGLQRRDFITLSDVCRSIAHLLKLPAIQLGDGLFNVGGEWSPTILEFAGIIRDRASQKLGVEVELSSFPAKDSEAASSFDYRIDKLRGTGFELRGQPQVEVDTLLDFCMTEFCYSSQGAYN